MLSRSLRDRISGLIRGGRGAPAEDGAAKSGEGTHHGNGHAANGHSGNGHHAHLVDDRSIITSGIEELLPGGLIQGPHGPAFVHERLYTDLGERPELVLARYEALCAIEPDPEPEPAVARPYDPALEPRVVYEYLRPGGGLMLTADLTKAAPKPWSGALRAGVRTAISSSMFLETSVGYLSLGQPNLRVDGFRLVASFGF